MTPTTGGPAGEREARMTPSQRCREEAKELVVVCSSLMSRTMGPFSPADGRAMDLLILNLEPMIADKLATRDAALLKVARAAKEVQPLLDLTEGYHVAADHRIEAALSDPLIARLMEENG